MILRFLIAARCSRILCLPFSIGLSRRTLPRPSRILYHLFSVGPPHTTHRTLHSLSESPHDSLTSDHKGPIPQSFGGMTSLEFLDLSNNDLSGVIPKSLEALGRRKRTTRLPIDVEYGREGLVSGKGDVYSYGIVQMATFTGKEPTDEIFAEERSLKQLVSESLRSSVMEVVDKNLLWREDEHFAAKECASSIMSLAMECTEESPKKGINTKVMVPKLLKIRDTLLANLEMVKGRRGSKLN
ncbi:hypothetical protein Patl1_10481 [Pistacia atlantica]|uniref:Uncharacterized protein n=1 Tax=Pistacia atlantica TaxID=434234 RepID=A0ACC1A8G5_9ROSI|nr:hypothetical protein Patl1_10481 [Pistacia atlantica]